MRFGRKNSGFSLMEVLTAVAVIAVLASILLSAGKGIRIKAERNLAESTVSIIVTALEQYYEFDGGFFEVSDPEAFGSAELADEMDLAADGSDDNDVAINAGNRDEYASCQYMYYMLSKVPNSRRIIDTISEPLVVSRNDGDDKLTYNYDGTDYDLVRIIDPWGNTFRYSYSDGDAFPLVESAGPDGDFDTLKDNVTSR